MKSVLLFLGGFVAGIIATILVAYFITSANQPNDGLPGLTLFPEKGECITSRGTLEVLQVLKPNMALAETGEFPDKILVLIINNEGKSYYDDQKIVIPSKKCARQIGTYQYTAKMGMDKTVPAVVIE